MPDSWNVRRGGFGGDATAWEADLTGGSPVENSDSDAYNTVREAVGYVPLPQQRQQ